jgi:hypothetical protein
MMTGFSARPKRAPTALASAQTRAGSSIIFAALEHGSTWATDPNSKVDGHVVLQAATERGNDFARRVGRELVRARMCPRPIPEHGIAVLSLASGVSSGQVEARCTICTAFLRCFVQTSVVVVLACDRRASRDERAHALALAEGLCEGRAGRGVVVRFLNAPGEQREESIW